MSALGWKQLLAGWPWFRGEGRFPMPSYSEYMPPPYLVRKPYGGQDLSLLRDDDPWGWPVTEYEEALALRPGLESVARQLLRQLVGLGGERHRHDIAHGKLIDNPYWSLELAQQAAELPGERFVLLLSLALSRTLDDKARVRWTLFGGSEQGPARPFWRGFFTGPNEELPAAQALGFFRTLLHTVYQEPAEGLDDLRRVGLRILPQGEDVPLAHWREGPLPSWTGPLLWEPGQSLRAVRYLLTFRPFTRLPAALRRAYLAGEVHLLPFPGSLLFWGVPGYLRLEDELPFAVQVPLLQQVDRHEGPNGLRVPQAGWMHEALDGPPHHHHGPVRGTFKRTRSTARVLRDEDELVTAHEDRLAHVLFGASPDDVGLYYKPMARNVQLWARDFRLLLDGPRADYDAIARAGATVAAGGVFGYRFLYPAMRVGLHELYWHRPLIAYRSGRAADAATVLDGPTGYLTAYRADKPDRAAPLELWPRLTRRELHVANLDLFQHARHERPHQTLLNVRKLLDTWQLLDERPLERSFARQLLTLAKGMSLDDWLASLPKKAHDRERASWLAHELRRRLGPEPPAVEAKRPAAPPSLTYRHTARRSFEVAYWKTIELLSSGAYLTKNNADPIRDPATQALRPGDRRDLDSLGSYLLERYTDLIGEHGLTGKALVGEMPFAWQTVFHYPWMGGWQHDREGKAHERNIVVVVPGRDRSRAVLMADHYDTAYMEDYYDRANGGSGARLAAPGADDNGSASAALLLGAPVFLELSRAGKLDCDIWLVHLTGEEYPGEGLGARQLCRCLVEGGLGIRLPGGAWHDLSGVAVKGIVVLDMVAHNSNQDRDVFQISPGTSRESMGLAYQAHVAAQTWNASLPAWNATAARRGAGRGKRSRSKDRIPALARHPHLYGEVRPAYDPRSTLYNTDADEFSDAGIPTVLFMENYDIHRAGYHDSADNMSNINLDYGAALAAITIEAVARLATEQPPAEGP